MGATDAAAIKDLLDRLAELSHVLGDVNAFDALDDRSILAAGVEGA